jgi:N-acetylglucosaminyldiphosphoundecaprenol N-acetyl-beta-D-mannosaminyltransferase
MPRLMGMPVHGVTLGEAVERIVDGVGSGDGGTVLTPNVDILRQYLLSPDLQSTFERTDLLLPDGMPLVVASRLQRTPVPGQVTGTDLLVAVCAEAAVRGVSVVLAGGHPGDAERAADRLRARFPGLRAETYPCFVQPDTEDHELAELSRMLAATRPGIVFLGLPFRAQVSVMDGLRATLPGTWFAGVGSSFELVNGDRTRAPVWIQRLCLEWAFRLTSQPWLWRRYLVDGMPTAARLAAAALRERSRRRPEQAAVTWPEPPRESRRL